MAEERRLGMLGVVQLKNGKVVAKKVTMQNGSFGGIPTADGRVVWRLFEQISPCRKG